MQSNNSSAGGTDGVFVWISLTLWMPDICRYEVNFYIADFWKGRPPSTAFQEISNMGQPLIILAFTFSNRSYSLVHTLSTFTWAKLLFSYSLYIPSPALEIAPNSNQAGGPFVSIRMQLAKYNTVAGQQAHPFFSFWTEVHAESIQKSRNWILQNLSLWPRRRIIINVISTASSKKGYKWAFTVALP